MTNRLQKRREFLKAGALALAAPYIIPAGALGKPGKPGANDRIYAGVIGPGGRSRALTGDCPADAKIVAVADCDLRRSAEYLGATRKFKNSVVAEKCAQYQDYRKMLAEEKLDGVFVTTPTHSRVLACMHAMQSGLILGYVGLIEGLVERFRAELGGQTRVIGTGGLASVLAKETKIIEVVDQMLTLEGLRLIYQLNQG